jgi:hypothetical protein
MRCLAKITLTVGNECEFFGDDNVSDIVVFIAKYVDLKNTVFVDILEDTIRLDQDGLKIGAEVTMMDGRPTDEETLVEIVKGLRERGMMLHAGERTKNVLTFNTRCVNRFAC